jgi:RNA ligase (TIGR02306 family)
MRTLASIQVVSQINPHPNADAIELATVRGWQVVVKKGEFQPGDFAVYFEIDSYLPIREEFEFLRKSCFRTHPELGEGFRLRTIKLRGELSQGLLLPISILDPFKIHTNQKVQCFDYRIWDPVIEKWLQRIIPLEEGADITKLLGVQKYEPSIPSHLAGNIKGNFPSFIRKTDQERVQNCWHQVNSLNIEEGWFIEEKLDGSSCTVYIRFLQDVAEGYYEMGVCSRNLELKLDDNENNAYIRTVTRDGWLTALPLLNKNIAIQAELCGPGIQGNKLKLDQTELFVFDIWLIDEQRHATRVERTEIVSDLIRLGAKIKQVPYLGNSHLPKTLEACLLMAEGKSKINPKAEREGIVFKSSTVIEGEVPSFKAISNRFLLKSED